MADRTAVSRRRSAERPKPPIWGRGAVPRDRHGPLGERGQASLELVAGVPALLLAGLIALQLLATGYAATLVDGAAEAGALAIAAGRAPAPAVADALPGWAEKRFSVDVEGGRIKVTLRPPAALPVLSAHLSVTSSAWALPPEGSR